MDGSFEDCDKFTESTISNLPIQESMDHLLVLDENRANSELFENDCSKRFKPSVNHLSNDKKLDNQANISNVPYRDKKKTELPHIPLSLKKLKNGNVVKNRVSPKVRPVSLVKHASKKNIHVENNKDISFCDKLIIQEQVEKQLIIENFRKMICKKKIFITSEEYDESVKCESNMALMVLLNEMFICFEKDHLKQINLSELLAQYVQYINILKQIDIYLGISENTILSEKFADIYFLFCNIRDHKYVSRVFNKEIDTQDCSNIFHTIYADLTSNLDNAITFNKKLSIIRDKQCILLNSVQGKINSLRVLTRHKRKSLKYLIRNDLIMLLIHVLKKQKNISEDSPAKMMIEKIRTKYLKYFFILFIKGIQKFIIPIFPEAIYLESTGLEDEYSLRDKAKQTLFWHDGITFIDVFCNSYFNSIVFTNKDRCDIGAAWQ